MTSCGQIAIDEEKCHPRDITQLTKSAAHRDYQLLPRSFWDRIFTQAATDKSAENFSSVENAWMMGTDSPLTALI